MSPSATGEPAASAVVQASVSPELTEWDQQTYLRLISTELSADQEHRILTPANVYARQDVVLAVHWHPEFIPMDLVRRRIDATFPNRNCELIVPTQHNILLEYDDFAGVEVDCYSRGFNRKVQLLIHFDKARTQGPAADVFKSMLAHTFRYRSHQLFDFIETIIDPRHDDRMVKAAAHTGASPVLVDFVRVHTRKLKELYEHNESITPPEAIKNKLLSQYFETLVDRFDEQLVNHARMFLKAVKAIVKRHFSLEFFFSTEEIIEEVRALGGGIVIPHPEQFWPILLADYDVDGYEVWNPQSREYTEFLINVVNQQNKRHGGRPILIFMGDDCHMGEKAKDPRYQDPEKAGREIGVQPPWEDLAIRKSLAVAGMNPRAVIDEYKQRLLG